MLTQQQAKALAHFVALLRPDWNAEGVYAALGRCKDRDPFATALASIRAAWDDGARTPGVIPADGPHWREMAGEAPKPPRVSYDVPCPEHPDQIHPCPRCKAATATGSNDHVTRLRAELQSQRSNFCSHGVPPARCAEHRDETTTPRQAEPTDQPEEGR